MANTSTDLLEMILRECAAAGAQPWYPSAYAQQTGLPRDALDASLDELRLGGLIRLTDWVQGSGQGYVLTPEGKEVVQSPRLLGRLRANGVPARPTPPLTKPGVREGHTTPWERGEDVRAALLSTDTPKVTLVLLFLNLLVFAYGYVLAVQDQVSFTDYIGGSSPRVLEILHRTGSLARLDIVVHNQWWRLLSLCFVHIGLLHLAVNMYTLYVIGPLLERMWGSWRFLVLYLISGLVGSCCMVVFSSGNGAGASGALWGVMASMATWVFLNRHHLPGSLVATWKRQLLIVFLLNVFITYSFPIISKAGHFGGGAAGLLVAVPMQYLRYGRGWVRCLAAAGMVAVPVVALAAVEYKIKPEREREQVEMTYLPRAMRVCGAEKRFCRQYVNSLKPVAERRKEANALLVGKAARDLDKHIKEAADFLASAPSFSDPVAAEAMEAAQQYLETAARFYDSLQRSLAPQGNWTDQNEKILQQDFTQLVSRRQRLETLVGERRGGR